MAKQNLWRLFFGECWVHRLPRLPAFWLKATFFSTICEYWFCKQCAAGHPHISLDLTISSYTCPGTPSSICIAEPERRLAIDKCWEIHFPQEQPTTNDSAPGGDNSGSQLSKVPIRMELLLPVIVTHFSSEAPNTGHLPFPVWLSDSLTSVSCACLPNKI